ncbi:4-(cytidine 5'-diphospho)-2-C-methyl-D-erythritol kinase [Variovorax sp. PCZ-1]|uniref:4-(cytidine 5'-diphospho)-2-C-methyl-D-erythritol kinase n=1 Tax=Variovorax sp. PCZ-1 TaxID=2835533 RepID=UPI001BD06BA5|nr:4-(cytidine 5'-diphospho)-2-C-methyl-D-erythritol kinase [Variovorax sp. PCZ-1]MBS7807844.1 4-(cytidine 5'-diphospho)-2-C-methyl-D-erythritol kinase [Variovorax sp. PCZ-1]
MKELRNLPAPAKLNLFLHITGRRADGYHLIESVFQLIDWQDTIHLELREDGQISREDLLPSAGASLPPDDLCTRAARALQSATGCQWGAHIQLEKRIPAQAGMGGGSSDAATCLLGLNRLWNLGLPLARLEQIGLTLGADVPFFLRGRNAWVSGIGEKIEPLPDGMLHPDQHFLVIKPENGLPTPAIFSHPALKRDTAHAIILVFAVNPYDFGCNDLQTVGELIEPQVNQALAILEKQGLKPRMTGSGSAVFAPCPVGFQPDTSVIPPSWQQRVCKTLSIHPVMKLLED